MLAFLIGVVVINSQSTAVKPQLKEKLTPMPTNSGTHRKLCQCSQARVVAPCANLLYDTPFLPSGSSYISKLTVDHDILRAHVACYYRIEHNGCVLP